MKKLLCVLLCAVLCLSVVLTACAPAEEDKPTPSSGEEEQPTPSSGEEDPEKPYEKEYDAEGRELVNLTDLDALSEAHQRFSKLAGEISDYWSIRLPLLKLPCNKTYYDDLLYAVNEAQHLIDMYAVNCRYYTAETYIEGNFMEATWQELIVPIAAHLSKGWIYNEQGWFKLNVSALQGDYYYAFGPDRSDLICFELLDAMINDRKLGGKTVDEDAVEALKDIIVNTVDTGCTVPGYEGGAKWTSQTTDLECRTIEQIFYDIFGDGVDGAENNNPEALEYNIYYSDVSDEDIQASLVMIKDQYNAWAEEYEALEPYAEAYEAYVNGRK